jgi:LysR family cyn operon transcriptional activator
MELRQLRYLIAISEELNINRAAKLCFVTQPALTQQIKKLEDEFNTSLLIRRGRGIILSDDGERLTRYARSLIKKVDAIKTEFTRPQKKHVNQVCLAAVPVIHKLIGAKKILELSKSNIKLKKMCNDQMEYELRRGLINAGISSIVPNIIDTYARTIAREKMYVVVSKNHLLNCSEEIDLKSIKNEPLALLSKELMEREYIDTYLKEKKVSVKLKLDIGSFDELISLIKYSNFISILPHSFISSFNDDELCKIEIINDDFCRELFLILDKNNKNNESFNILNSCFTDLTKSIN